MITGLISLFVGTVLALNGAPTFKPAQMMIGWLLGFGGVVLVINSLAQLP